MGKLSGFFVAIIFLFSFFPWDEAAGGSGKDRTVSGGRQKLVWKAEMLRTQLLSLGKKQRLQAQEMGKFLREMKEAENLSASFYQGRVEKIIETSRSFFWGRKEVIRKKFSAMPPKDLRLEVQKLEAEIQAMEDCLEYFADEAALMVIMFGTSKPSPSSPLPSGLKMIRTETPL